jgi:DNA-directed RNA polymerase subunit RPC12/RpoP
MNIVHIHVALKSQKEHSCPRCSKVARLITDIDEREPRRDEKGNLQYYCISCHTTFSVDRHGHTIIIR